MRICEIKNGVVIKVVDLPDGYSIASDKKSASGMAACEFQGPDGAGVRQYESTYNAIDGATLVASANAQPGWGYAGGKFSEPAAEPVPPKRQFSFLEFMDLFTDAEQLAIAGAAMTDAATKLWYDRAVGASFISLDDPRLTAGMEALVTAKLLLASRRDRVLQGLAPLL